MDRFPAPGWASQGYRTALKRGALTPSPATTGRSRPSWEILILIPSGGTSGPGPWGETLASGLMIGEGGGNEAKVAFDFDPGCHSTRTAPPISATPARSARTGSTRRGIESSPSGSSSFQVWGGDSG